MHDDSTPHQDVTAELTGKVPVDGPDGDDLDEVAGVVDDSSDDVDLDLKDEEDDELFAGDEGESWSDDPVRMYLTQMGEIPLLTRKEEISLAKRIETTRGAFRRKLRE